MGDNTSMTVFDLALLLAAVIILFAALSVRIGSRLGLPALLLFLLIGMVLGPAGFGVQFNDPELARGLGLAALALILAEGGLSARWHEIRPALAPAGLLATVGSATSIGVMAVFCHCVFSIDWTVAALLGAVTAPTDSAAVFSILRGVSLPSRLKSILEAESGLNDAPTVLVVVALSAMATGDPLPGGVWGLIVSIVVQLAAGVLVGLLVGWLGAHVTRRVKLPSSSLYGVVAMCWASLAYGLAVLGHVSGFAAVYVAAVVIGNSDLPYQHATELFAEGVGWICQIGLFVMLGLLANPDRLTWVPVLQGVVIGLFLTLVVRPLAVFVSTVWFRTPWRHQVFLSWAGLRGAVPIILATIPISDDLVGADRIFDAVLVLVVVCVLAQGPTLPTVGALLGLVDASAVKDVDIEVAPLGDVDAELIQVNVPIGSQLSGTTVGELQLPANTIVSLIIRGEQSFAPGADTSLLANDELLIVTPSAQRHAVAEQLTEIGHDGRSARCLRGSDDQGSQTLRDSGHRARGSGHWGQAGQS